MVSSVPPIRVQFANDRPVIAERDFVLYWMIAFRRTHWNFSLERAVEWARELQKPLLVFEPLRIGYPWASDRFHRFVIDGMADNAGRIESIKSPGVVYFPYVEPTADAGKELLAALAAYACVVVTDYYPAFFLPRMVAAAALKLPVKMEAVDSNGLLPIRSVDRVFSSAYSFRRALQKQLPAHLAEFPKRDPLAKLKLPPLPALPNQITRRWPAASSKLLAGNAPELDRLPIDHSVAVASDRGGGTEGRKRLRGFLKSKLHNYCEGASHPDKNARSGLSSYLHFGHLSAHEVFAALASHEHWNLDRLSCSSKGQREGWWGMSADAEAWTDQLVTWRELGYNMSAHCSNYDQYESLPEWAQTTLQKHARDSREHVYSLDEFAEAKTHDGLWNAAQNELLREGTIHNYLRMLWGKKILEWTPSPREALDVMIELNNKYALDGRDPNSYSGIFWVLGRYDRPWAPERPIFGTVRFMSSSSTRRKIKLKEYLAEYG